MGDQWSEVLCERETGEILRRLISLDHSITEIIFFIRKKLSEVSFLV